MFQNTATPAEEDFTFNKNTKDQSELLKELKNFTNIDLVKSQNLLSQFSNDILGTFTQTRERIFEIQDAITSAIPGVQRLGGGIKSVTDTINGVALATRRNVVASTEDIEKLYAATKVLGGTAQEISDAFLNVGVGIESIPETLEDSIKYVQSIGGNAKQVMKDVTENMEQMNRFQFEGGVQGLTKMAAQASMLRFSMKETFTLANTVLSPDGAIKTAAAFQRLGLSVGSLGNPLQLMNQAITDPSGLQDSLIEVSKQFIELNRETNKFEINPEGVLRLRALEDQTGVSAAEMTRAGLAAAEMGRRLEAVNDAGLTIVSEEDKQYLANIANMEGGSYKVTLQDGTKKELADLQQKDFEALLQAQKDEPKTLEEIARAQLTTDELAVNELKAIRGIIAGGVVTADPMQKFNEGIRTITEGLTKDISESKTFQVQNIRDTVSGFFNDEDKIAKLTTDAARTGNLDVKTLMDSFFGEGETSKLKDFGKEAKKAVEEIATKLVGSIKELASKSDVVPPPRGTRGPNSSEPVTTGGISVGGLGGSNGNGGTTTNPRFNRPITNRSADVNFDGGIDVNVKFDNIPVGFTPQQKDEATKMIADAFARLDFNKMIKEIVKNDDAIPRSSNRSSN
jgi:hypothetical protein